MSLFIRKSRYPTGLASQDAEPICSGVFVLVILDGQRLSVSSSVDYSFRYSLFAKVKYWAKLQTSYADRLAGVLAFNRSASLLAERTAESCCCRGVALVRAVAPSLAIVVESINSSTASRQVNRRPPITHEPRRIPRQPFVHHLRTVDR
jgi:hypothetical protein